MFIAVFFGKVVPHDGSLSVVGVSAAEYVSGDQLAQRYTPR